MEKKPYLHEVVSTAKEIGGLVMGWAANLIVPDDAFDNFVSGGGPLLDKELYDQPEIPDGDWDSLRGV